MSIHYISIKEMPYSEKLIEAWKQRLYGYHGTKKCKEKNCSMCNSMITSGIFKSEKINNPISKLEI